MKDKIEAVVFDIDGTLYPDLLFYIRVSFYFIKNFRFFLHFNKVRKMLHNTAPLANFFEYQARLLASSMHICVEDARRLIDEKVYNGFMPYFKKVKPYKDVLETFKALKEAGLKVGVLSDLPPQQKGDIWGVAKYCDVILGSEEIGALKPSKFPFGVVAMTLDLPMEKILYVGNSIRCDVNGAKNAGMYSAYKMPFWRAILHLPLKKADISFSSYQQLKKLILVED